MSELSIELKNKILQRWPEFPNITEANIEKPTPQFLIRFFQFFVDDILKMLMDMVKIEVEQKHFVPPAVEQLSVTAPEIYTWFLTNQLFQYKESTIKLNDIIEPGPKGIRVRSLLGVCMHFLDYVNSKVEDPMFYDLYDNLEEMACLKSEKEDLIKESNELAEKASVMDEKLKELESEDKALSQEVNKMENKYYELKAANAKLEPELAEIERQLAELNEENKQLAEEYDRLQAQVVEESTVEKIKSELSKLQNEQETCRANNVCFMESIRSAKESFDSSEKIMEMVSKLKLQNVSLDVLNKELKEVQFNANALTDRRKNLESKVENKEFMLREKKAIFKKLEAERQQQRVGIETYLKKSVKEFDQQSLTLKKVVKQKQDLSREIELIDSNFSQLQDVFKKEYHRILMSQKALFATSKKYKKHFS